MQISLNDFMNGAVEERAAEEMEKVIENILDPNTDDKARKLNIEFKIEPGSNGKSAKMSFVVKSKLRPAQSLGTIIAIGQTKDGFDAAEIGDQLPGQLSVDVKTGDIKENGSLKNRKNKISVVGE